MFKGLRVPLSLAFCGIGVLWIMGFLSKGTDSSESVYPHADYSQDISKIYYDLGCWQVKRKDYQQAVKAFQIALREKPDFIELYDQIGIAYEQQGNVNEALKMYFKALRVDVHFDRIRFNHGGEQHFVPTSLPVELQKKSNFWQGESLVDKTLLVYTLESSADVIQFLRFIPDLADKAQKIILVVDAPLVKLCKSLKRKITNFEVVEKKVRLSKKLTFDYYVDLAHVPSYLYSSYRTLPGKKQYLWADQSLVKKYKATLFDEHKTLAVGLACYSDAQEYYHQDVLTQAVLDQYSKGSNVTFYALQAIKQNKPVEFVGQGNTIVDISLWCKDFAHAAAVIANCDVVIALDNVFAHLAGALGKKTILMLPSVTDWRWLCYAKNNSNVWYNSMTTLRTNKSVSWDQVINKAFQVALLEQNKLIA
jgi:tetratricopeptide (TPR) repeat protein